MVETETGRHERDLARLPSCRELGHGGPELSGLDVEVLDGPEQVGHDPPDHLLRARVTAIRSHSAHAVEETLHLFAACDALCLADALGHGSLLSFLSTRAERSWSCRICCARWVPRATAAPYRAPVARC